VAAKALATAPMKRCLKCRLSYPRRWRPFLRPFTSFDCRMDDSRPTMNGHFGSSTTCSRDAALARWFVGTLESYCLSV
jgi:hypothetical protein